MITTDTDMTIMTLVPTGAEELLDRKYELIAMDDPNADDTDEAKAEKADRLAKLWKKLGDDYAGIGYVSNADRCYREAKRYRNLGAF